MQEPLNRRKCVPCEGGAKPLNREQAEKLIQEIPAWKLSGDAKSISREFTFDTFMKAMAFVDQVADLAEYEDHHPGIHLSYTHLRLELSTHAIKGLSENDFILAAKIDKLPKKLKKP